MWIYLIFALLGWLIGIIINALADFLPEWRSSEEAVKMKRPLSGILLLYCGEAKSVRPWLIELVTITLFAILPALIPNRINLAVNSFYIAVLLLIIVIDLEHKLIFDVVTYPVTLLALLGSFIVTREENSIGLALVGAVVGLVMFWVLYKLANMVYGTDSGALGAGDVKLSMLMGAMLGFHRIFFALALGVALGGVSSLLLLLSRRVNRESALPYGQYLAIAAIVMLIWGAAYARQFLN